MSVPREVLYFTDSDTVGGAERALLTLVSQLDRSRWTPRLMHHGGAGIAPLVTEAHALGVPDEIVPRIRGRQDVGAFVRLVGRLARRRPAAFHANLVASDSCRHALLAATVARVPVIVATQHYGGMSTTLRRRRHRLALRGVQRFIAVSDDCADRLRASLGADASRVVVVHNGIALDRFEPSRTGRQSRTRDTVLTVGRLDEKKGHRFLLDAMARLPDLHLVLAGDGPERAALEARARDLGIDSRIAFVGWRDDVPALLSACDVFVLPSLAEGHPLSVLEAMAAARPVVASDVGGTREAVENGETGLLVPPADPVALADALHAVLGDPSRADAMGAAGRARVQRDFAAPIMARRVTQLYDELLERSA